MFDESVILTTIVMLSPLPAYSETELTRKILYVPTKGAGGGGGGRGRELADGLERARVAHAVDQRGLARAYDSDVDLSA